MLKSLRHRAGAGAGALLRQWHRLQIMTLTAGRGSPAPSAAKVLFWVPGGMTPMLHVEGAIALALRQRGAEVHAVICDGPFLACMRREAPQDIPPDRWGETCRECRREAARVLETLCVPHSFIGDHVPPEVRSRLRARAESAPWESIEDLAFGDARIGGDVRSSVYRYFKGRKPADLDFLVAEYSYTALMNAAAAFEVIDFFRPDSLFMSHGIYADWGPALHAALARGVGVTAWRSSYLPGHFYFRHITAALRRGRRLSPEMWAKAVEGPLTGEKKRAIKKYLAERYKSHVSFDIKRPRTYRGSSSFLRRELGLDGSRPVWGIMAHINWDAVSEYSPMAYETFNDWITDTVETIAATPSVQWVVKIHPNEAVHNPDSGVERLVAENFPTLPSHVKVLPPSKDVSPLDFFGLVDGGVTVYGTSGLELVLQGKPVILAGEAHYGGRGFTHDGLDRESYRGLLRRAASLGPVGPGQLELARKYAHLYFVRQQVPLEVVRGRQSDPWRFQFHRRRDLLPGRSPFVDFVCERILDRGSFTMDDRLARLALRERAARPPRRKSAFR